MAENKTKPTDADVTAFLAGVEQPRRGDAEAVIAIMRRATGAPPVMWGPSIIGFGSYHYVHDSGRSGDAPRLGFSPRKAAMTFYLTSGHPMRDDMLKRLGKHKVGKGCLYINKLADVDMDVLERMIAATWTESNERYPE